MQMMRIPTVWTVNLVALLFGIGMYSIVRVPPAVPADPRGRRLRLRRQRHRVRPAPAAADRRDVRRPASPPAGSPPATGSKALLVARRRPHRGRHVRRSPSPTTSSGWSSSRRPILGLAFGLAFAAMSNLVVAAVPQSQTGVASGMNTNIRTVGGAIGSAVVATVVTGQLQPSGFPSESGYTNGFLRPRAHRRRRGRSSPSSSRSSAPTPTSCPARRPSGRPSTPRGGLSQAGLGVCCVSMTLRSSAASPAAARMRCTIEFFAMT